MRPARECASRGIRSASGEGIAVEHNRHPDLVAEALRIIEALVAARGTGAIIFTPRGRSLTSQYLAKAMEAVQEGRFNGRVTAHDPRRTAATLALSLLRLDLCPDESRFSFGCARARESSHRAGKGRQG